MLARGTVVVLQSYSWEEFSKPVSCACQGRKEPLDSAFTSGPFSVIQLAPPKYFRRVRRHTSRAVELMIANVLSPRLFLPTGASATTTYYGCCSLSCVDTESTNNGWKSFNSGADCCCDYFWSSGTRKCSGTDCFITADFESDTNVACMKWSGSSDVLLEYKVPGSETWSSGISPAPSPPPPRPPPCIHATSWS